MRKRKFLIAVLFNSIVGMVISSITGASPIACAVAINCIGAFMYQLNRRYRNLAFAGLATEVWLPDVKDNFYPDDSFMKEAVTMDAFVKNDTINLQEAGIDPTVLINNNTFPIPVSVAGDVPLALPLSVYDTTSTIIRNAQALTFAYDQRTLYTAKHKRALSSKFAIKAAHAYAPAADNDFNKVIKTAAKDSFIDVLIDLEKAFNDWDIPEENRVIVLSSSDQARVSKENKNLFKEIMAKPGNVLYGFKIYRFSKLPSYNIATGKKNAFGAAFTAGTDATASIAFSGGEVMKALGTFEFFSRLKDPDVKGDIFNFQMRGTALPIRNKYTAAVYQG